MTDEGEREDWQLLIVRVRKRDPSAQRALVTRLWPLVAGTVCNLCPRRDSVEDLAQETFLRVFEKLSQYRGGSFTAWVCQIARRVAYDALRRQQVRPEWTFTDLDYKPGNEGPGLPDQSSNVADARQILERLFRDLPDDSVWLLNEVELKERAIGEVAREMGWSATAGRLRLMRARRKLKAAYLKIEKTKRHV